MSSEVFAAHFSNEWKDKDEVLLAEDDYEVILSIFSFIYTGITKVDMNNLFQVLTVAHRFMLNDLISCLSDQTFRNNDIRKLYAWQYVSFALLVNDTCFINNWIGLIDDNAVHFLDSPEFLAVSGDVIAVVIKRDTFKVKEVDLFKSLIEWSIASCQRQDLEVTPENQRNVMDSFIHRIRFPLMTEAEFIETVEVTRILSDDERISILRCISSGIKYVSDFDFNPRNED